MKKVNKTCAAEHSGKNLEEHILFILMIMKKLKELWSSKWERKTEQIHVSRLYRLSMITFDFVYILKIDMELHVDDW